jgi:hypothetical protein
MTTVDLSRARWRKSVRSGQNGNCVEIAGASGMIAMRDSKDPHGPVLAFSPQEMRAFLDEAKANKYDL